MNFDTKPTTLHEAVDSVIDQLTEKDIKFIKENSDNTAHFGLGRFMHNEWGLWDKDAILPTYFRDAYKIWHADDMSGLILHGVWCKVRDVQTEYGKVVVRYHTHWKGYGLDPHTGEKIDK